MQSVLSVIALVAAALVILLALVGLASVLFRSGRFVVRTGASLTRTLNGPGTPPPPRPSRRTHTAPHAHAEPPADAANGPSA